MTWREARRDLAFAAGLATCKPFQVLLQVTNRCNMKCPFCDFWPNGVPPKDELTLADYDRLTGELAELGTFLVSVEGGEPFLRPDLVDIIRLLSRKHLPLLYTNGWYVTPEKASAAFAAGLTQVGVSIDFPDAARHDAKRVWPLAFDKAWAAVRAFRDAAPHAGRQVHVMTVLMEENWRDLEELLKASAAEGVGHCITLLSTEGFRRAEAGGELPRERVARRLVELWERYPHFRIFRQYLEGIDDFLSDRDLPECHAGVQSFNIDHIGNVSPCIEKIGIVAGNVRKESLKAIHARMSRREGIRGCQDCWTACRGFAQALGGGGTWAGWRDLGGRMRSI